MEKQQAFTLLGLNEHYSAADLTGAVVAKKQLLQQKRDAAPTEALKAKFEMMLLQVDEAAAVLQSALTQASSSLSQTKLADLPSMGAGDAEQLALQHGQVLAGRYEIKELLGKGGMGVVYRARDKNRGQDIAIKLLLPSLTKNERARERFLNEARLSSSLSHPNIVNVFDVQNDGDLYFLTMELLEGQDLRQVMENQKRAGRPFDVAEVKLYISAISAALAEAHKFTVHRDIKPENIWLTEEGQLKLMDFGIAQVQSASQRTQTGAAMGTAYYMAPEQLKGQKDIDGRADQYAVAVLAYELLTGEVPAGVIEPVAQLRKDVPKVMAQTIMQALQSRPENRFADISSFNDAFQSGKAPKAGKTKTTNYASSSTSNNSQSKWPMVAGVIAVLVLSGGLFGTGVVTVDDVKKLLPVSKEIIAAQKAEVAKVQGEIKVLKQRLDNGRRQLDSDVRDAERNKDENLTALNQWQALTERVIFEGNFITELEGELSMAESLLRENALEQAKTSVDKVRDGYKQLWDNFVAGEQVSTLSPTVAALRKEWQSKPNSKTWPVSQSTEALYQEAQQHEIDGQLQSAQPLLEQLDKGYRALFAANDDIGSINNELNQAQAGWQKLATSKQLTDVPEIISLQTEEKTHRGALAAATDLSAITQAMQGLKGQIETYTSLTASVQNLAQAEKSAQSAQSAFEKSRQGYPLPANATAVKAAEYFTQARTALQNKNWVAAGKGFADSKQQFEQAQQQEAKLRVEIDRTRTAQMAYQKAEQGVTEELTNNPDADEAKRLLALAEKQLKESGKGAPLANYVAARLSFEEALRRIQIAKQEHLKNIASGTLVTIPAGHFQMGDTSGNQYDAIPVRNLTLKAFKMQEHEVTFTQWDLCMEAGGCSHKPDDRGWGRGNRPVINVSYNDITQQFIPWLNKITGKRFRLPTEAEWEYAARAGSSQEYSWGDGIGSNRANCDGCGSHWDNRQTAPVKSFIPNAFGLYDMHGNLREWVQDCWNASYSGAPTNGGAWLGGDCRLRVLRGGSWFDGTYGLHSAKRFTGSVSFRFDSNGFRLVQDN